jgi:hypothetical protein
MYRRGVLKTSSRLRLEYAGDGLNLTPPTFDNSNKNRVSVDTLAASSNSPKRAVSWIRQLYDVLQHPDPRVSSMLAWSSCGTAFGIHEDFIEELCGDGKPFIASNFKSFRRRLTKYGLFVSPYARPQRGRVARGGGYIAFYTKEGLHRDLTWEGFSEVLKRPQEFHREQNHNYSASAASTYSEDPNSLASLDDDISTPKRKRDRLIMVDPDTSNTPSLTSMRAVCHDVATDIPRVTDLTQDHDGADSGPGVEQVALAPKGISRNGNGRSATVTTPPLPKSVVEMVSYDPLAAPSIGTIKEICPVNTVQGGDKSIDHDIYNSDVDDDSHSAVRSDSHRSAQGQAENDAGADKNTNQCSSSSSAREEPCTSVSNNTSSDNNNSIDSNNVSLGLALTGDELKRVARAGGVTVRSLERNQIEDPTDRFREPRENSRGSSAASGLSAGCAQDRDPLDGRRVQIFWPTIHQWFDGTLHTVGTTPSLYSTAPKPPLDLQRGGGKFRVAYDDGDEEVVSEAYLRLHKNVYLYPYTPTAKELEANALAEAKAKADNEAAAIAAEKAKEEAAEKAAAEKAAAAAAKAARKKALMVERANKRSPNSKPDVLAASAPAANQALDSGNESSSDSDSSEEEEDNKSNALDATGYAALTCQTGNTPPDAINIGDDGNDHGDGGLSGNTQNGRAGATEVLGPGQQVWFSPRRRRWVARVAWRGAYVTLGHTFARRHALAVLKRARELVPLAVEEANALAVQAVPLAAVSATPAATAAPTAAEAPAATECVPATPAPAAELAATAAVVPAATTKAVEDATNASRSAEVLPESIMASSDETSALCRTSTNGDDDVIIGNETPAKRPRNEPQNTSDDSGATSSEGLENTTSSEDPSIALLTNVLPTDSSSSSPSSSESSPSSKLLLRSGRLAGLPPEIDPDKAENDLAKIAKAEAEELAVLKAEAKAAKRNGDGNVNKIGIDNDRSIENGNGNVNGNGLNSLSLPAPDVSNDASSSSIETLAPVVATLPSPPIWLSTILASTSALDAHFDAAARIATRSNRTKPHANIQNLLRGRNSNMSSNMSSTDSISSISSSNDSNSSSSSNSANRVVSPSSSSGAASMDLDGKTQREPEDPVQDDEFSDTDSDDDHGGDARSNSSPKSNETRRSPLVYRKKVAMPERVKVDETFAHALDGIKIY